MLLFFFLWLICCACARKKWFSFHVLFIVWVTHKISLLLISTNEKEFDFDSNDFSGEFLASIFNVSSIQWINFRNNSLSGSLPDEVCSHLPKLRVLWLNDNELSGDIPSHLGECRVLQKLSLYGNKFTGFIPRRIGNLTLLKWGYTLVETTSKVWYNFC